MQIQCQKEKNFVKVNEAMTWEGELAAGYI